MDITIAKYELYPQDEPQGYAVGFSVTASNGRNIYRDCLVTYDRLPKDFKDEDVVNTAWNDLKAGVEIEINKLETKSPLLGSTWSPVVQETKTEVKVAVDPTNMVDTSGTTTPTPSGTDTSTNK